ncbi:MAG TPA: tetratricopeptide repeat protein [Flavisolibacter sp.]
MIRSISFCVLLLSAIASCKNPDAPSDAFLEAPPFSELTDSIRKFPENAALYYRRGTLLYENNHLQHAEKDLRTAWKLDPTEAYALRLETILREQKKTDVIPFLEEAGKKLPGSLPIRITLARAYQENGDTARAAKILDAVLEQYPGQLDALTLKSQLLSNTDQKLEAISYLERAHELVPSDPEIAYQLAFAYAEAKDPKAVKLSDSLIRADKTGQMAEPWFFKGVYYSNIANYPEALRNFDETIRRAYNFLDAYINKAIIYYDQKKYDEALKVLQLGLTIDPTYADTFYWIGKVQEAKGDREHAKENYQKAYSLDKNLVRAKEAADRL